MRTVAADIVTQLQSGQLRPFLLLHMEIDSSDYTYTDCDIPISTAWLVEEDHAQWDSGAVWEATSQLTIEAAAQWNSGISWGSGITWGASKAAIDGIIWGDSLIAGTGYIFSPRGISFQSVDYSSTGIVESYCVPLRSSPHKDTCHY